MNKITGKIAKLNQWGLIAIAFLIMALNSSLETAGLDHIYASSLLRFVSLVFYFTGFLSCLLKTELYEKLGLLAFTAWILEEIL